MKLRRRKRKRSCVVCKRRFALLAYDTATHCSDECRQKTERNKGRKRWDKVKTGKRDPYSLVETIRTCITCGVEFLGVRPKRYCSLTCRQPTRRRDVEVVERVGLGYLLKRDGGRCQLCRRKVTLSARFPDPRCPTIDHIKPVSRGGKHERRNLQLACLKCNMKKRDKGGGQLLLFG